MNCIIKSLSPKFKINLLWNDVKGMIKVLYISRVGIKILNQHTLLSLIDNVWWSMKESKGLSIPQVLATELFR